MNDLQRFILKSFKRLLPTGSSPFLERKLYYMKLLEFYKTNVLQNGINAVTAEFDLWCEKFRSQHYSLPFHTHNAIDMQNLCNNIQYFKLYLHFYKYFQHCWFQ